MSEPWLALSLLERIVDWVRPLYLHAGYAVIAGAVVLERSIFIGIVVPGDIILALGGVYAAQHRLSIVAVIVIGAAAAIIGESCGFWLGRRYGPSIIRRVPFVGNWLSGQLEEAQDYFRKRGGLTVALGRYATAAGAFVPFTAGAGKMPYRRFLAFDVPAVVVWATGISLAGYLAGANLQTLDTWLSRFGWIMLGILVGYFAGRFAWKRWKGRRERQSAGSAKDKG
jgi:membrane-associated protein